jgi:hypothetical protein
MGRQGMSSSDVNLSYLLIIRRKTSFNHKLTSDFVDAQFGLPAAESDSKLQPRVAHTWRST